MDYREMARTLYQTAMDINTGKANTSHSVGLNWIADQLMELSIQAGGHRLVCSNGLSASEIGRMGGKAKTEAKQKASRENGKKGGYPKGRPRKEKSE